MNEHLEVPENLELCWMDINKNLHKAIFNKNLKTWSEINIITGSVSNLTWMDLKNITRNATDIHVKNFADNHRFARLNDISMWEDGWLDGEGYRISSETFVAALEFLVKFSNSKNFTKNFGIFLTEDGCASFEYVVAGSYSISFDVNNGTIEAMMVSVDGKTEFATCHSVEEAMEFYLCATRNK